MRTIVIGILFMLLSSCASMDDSEVKKNDFVYQPPLKNGDARQLVVIPDSWKLSGKIAILGEEDNWYANYFWSKQKWDGDQEQRKIIFSGPLGETQMELTQIKHGELLLNLLAVGGETYTDFSLSQILSQEFGFEVPILSLEYWIFGQINPQQTFTVSSLSESGQLLEIQQHDWKILYSYKTLQSSFPKKVVAENKDYKIKVYIRHSSK